MILYEGTSEDFANIEIAEGCAGFIDELKILFKESSETKPYWDYNNDGSGIIIYNNN